jgi:hypothetical protein
VDFRTESRVYLAGGNASIYVLSPAARRRLHTLISNITDAVIREVKQCQGRPLEDLASFLRAESPDATIGIFEVKKGKP